MNTKINVNKASILSCTNIFPNICVKISKSSKILKINNLLTNPEWATPENG